MRSNVFPEAGAKIEERLATARTRVVEKHEMCRPKGTGKQRGRKDVQDSAKRVIESREQRPQDMALAAAEVLDDFANKVSTELMRYLEPGSKTREKLDAIIKHKKHLSRSPQNSLEKALDRIIEHAEGLKNQLSK